MKIAILSNGDANYSTKRLVEEAKARGHEVDVIKYKNCYISIEPHQNHLPTGSRRRIGNKTKSIRKRAIGRLLIRLHKPTRSVQCSSMDLPLLSTSKR